MPRSLARLLHGDALPDVLEHPVRRAFDPIGKPNAAAEPHLFQDSVVQRPQVGAIRPEHVQFRGDQLVAKRFGVLHRTVDVRVQEVEVLDAVLLAHPRHGPHDFLHLALDHLRHGVGAEGAASVAALHEDHRKNGDPIVRVRCQTLLPFAVQMVVLQELASAHLALLGVDLVEPRSHEDGRVEQLAPFMVTLWTELLRLLGA